MMNWSFPPQVPSLQRAAARLARLPGVGPKTAERISYHLLRIPKEDVDALVKSLQDVVKKVQYCSSCHNLTETDPCGICASATRDRTTICVVQNCQDVQALERTGAYQGLYHVLGGVLSPMDGVGPEDLTFEQLLSRLEGINEIVIATHPTVEGETTATYLFRLLKNSNLTVTKMARGLPMGGDLEYIDEVTLGEALKGRRQVEK